MHNATLPLLTERASAPLVALLSGVGVAAFGLCGADKHILRIRKLSGHSFLDRGRSCIWGCTLCYLELTIG